MTKEELLKITLATAVVAVGDSKLTIKELTTSDREQYEMTVVKSTSKNLKALLIVKSVITDDGNRMFGDDEINTVSQMPSSLTEALFNQILILNGMADGSLEDAEGK